MSDISTKQRKAIEALAAGHTNEHSAAIAGVTERTVYRWRSEDESFKYELQHAIDSKLHDGMRSLSAALSDAIDVLHKIATDDKAPPQVRVSAAKTIVDSVLKVRDQYEIEKRLQQLERGLIQI